MQRWPGNALQICLLLNLFNMIFVVHVKPFNDSSINKKEMLNEYVILTCSTILLTFSDFVNNLEVQNFYCGWAFVLILGICILINLIYLLSYLFHIVRLNAIRFYNRNCNCFKK